MKFFAKFSHPKEDADRPVLVSSKTEAVRKLKQRESKYGEPVTLHLWEYYKVAPHPDMNTETKNPDQVIRLTRGGNPKRIE